MPVKIVRRDWKSKEGVIINETYEAFEQRVSSLIDVDGWEIIAVLPDKEEGCNTDPIFILTKFPGNPKLTQSIPKIMPDTETRKRQEELAGLPMEAF